MNRIDVLLLILTVGSALALVYTTQKSRSLLMELEREALVSEQLNNDARALMAERATLGNSARVDTLATQSLHMRAPKPGEIRWIEQERGAR